MQRLGLVGAELVEPLVDLGVDAGDEERGDRVQAGQVGVARPGLLEAGEERVHDRAVAVEGEDQRDVDRDARAHHLGDGGQALDRRGDLDEHVRAVDRGREGLGLLDRPGGVVGEPRVDLDRHPAVLATGGLVDRQEDVARVADVLGREGEHGLVDGLPGVRELAHLGVVGVPLGQGGLEDRRVGGDPDDPLGRR